MSAFSRPIEQGLTVTSAARTLGEGDVSIFAGLTGDFTPIHIDEEFAKTTPHGTRITHGTHSMAAAIGLATHTGVFGDRVIGMLNISWDFMGVVKIGETIHSRVIVENIRPTSKPGRNVATYTFEVLNQRDEIVQRGRMVVLVRAD